MKKKSKFFFAVLTVLFLSATFLSCREDSGVPTLIWWQIGGNNPRLPMYSRFLSEFTYAEIGVRVEIRQGTWGGAAQRFNAMINTGEYFDIMFSDVNTFTHFARLGAFADLTDLVREVSPDLFYSMPEDLWMGVSLDGRIMGVPTYKDSASTDFAFWDAALVERYGLDIDDNSWQGWDRNFRKIQAGGSIRHPYYLSRHCVDAIFLGFIGPVPMLPPVGVWYSDGQRRVVNTLEHPRVVEGYRYMRRWFLDGIINPEANFIDATPPYRPFFIAQAWPSVAASFARSAGIEAYLPSKLFGPVFSMGSIQGSINTISVNSRHKREALKLLELVNTNSTFRDMLSFGIEGDHFEYVYMPDDGRRAIRRLRTDWPLINFMIGNFFILTPEDVHPAGFWDEVRYLNNTAFTTPMLGFTMDISPVESEVMNTRNTWGRFATDLRTGAVDPDVELPRIITELRRRGLDRIIAEAQRQIDEFFDQ